MRFGHRTCSGRRSLHLIDVEAAHSQARRRKRPSPMRAYRAGYAFSSSQMGSNSHSESLLAQAVPAITRRWNIWIAHDSHRRIRTGPASVVARAGGQFRLGRQSGGVHPSSMGLIFRTPPAAEAEIHAQPRSVSLRLIARRTRMSFYGAIYAFSPRPFRFGMQTSSRAANRRSRSQRKFPINQNPAAQGADQQANTMPRALSRCRSADAKRIAVRNFKRPQRPRATWSLPRREARGAFGLI
jgi:hypothetical protein